MSAEHTPGPWTILPNTPHFVRAMHPAEGMQPVATVYHFDGELAANARLIASAPELLEALELALVTIGGQAELLRACGAAYGIGATLQRASEAIAKAKGGAQ